MLDALGPLTTPAKAKDLLARLDNVDPDQCIPAEYELCIGYALAQKTVATVEPNPNKAGPDFLTVGLLPGIPVAVEVTALSDDAFSGKAAMDRTAHIVDHYANQIRPKAEKNLYYNFLETSGYKPSKLAKPIGPWTHESKYWRKRLTSHKFALTEDHKKQIAEWLKDWPPPGLLRIVATDTVFDMSWKEWVHPMTKTFSSMPSEVYDLQRNALYERLKDKEKKQLSKAPDGYLRCVILGDAGCSLLSQPHISPTWARRHSGADIIWEFLRNSTVDLVIILSPQQTNDVIKAKRYWNPEIYDKANHDRVTRPEGFYDTLHAVIQTLPAPQLRGYQARSFVQQRMLLPQARGMHLPMSWGGDTVRISSRALLELLAGRMDARQYEHFVTGKHNPFEVKLSRGFAISDIKVEPHGPENDDDYVVISFAPDPNASALNMPPQLKKD